MKAKARAKTKKAKTHPVPKPKTRPKPKPKEKPMATRKTPEEPDTFEDQNPQAKPARENRIDNRDQDPSHPANTTQSAEREAVPRGRAEGFGVNPADLLTEQEKGAPDPVGQSQNSPGPVETIEEQGITPRMPYPTGNPPAPREEITRSQGIKDEESASAKGNVTDPTK